MTNQPKSKTPWTNANSDYGDMAGDTAKYVPADKVAKLEAVKIQLEVALRIIPPYKLKILADYLDITDIKMGVISGIEVQTDLRRMAILSEAALKASEDLSNE